MEHQTKWFGSGVNKAGKCVVLTVAGSRETPAVGDIPSTKEKVYQSPL